MEYSQFQMDVYPSLKEKTAAIKGSANLLGQNPYVIYLALKHSGRFSIDDLVLFQRRLVDIDLTFKSSSTEPKLLLECFLAEICK